MEFNVPCSSPECDEAVFAADVRILRLVQEPLRDAGEVEAQQGELRLVATQVREHLPREVLPHALAQTCVAQHLRGPAAHAVRHLAGGVPHW